MERVDTDVLLKQNNEDIRMRKLGGKACDKAMDMLPIPDELRDDAKVICKAVVGGPIGAILHITKIGPEPDRSEKAADKNEKKPAETRKNTSSSSSLGNDRLFSDHSRTSNSRDNMSRELTRDEKENETFDSWLSRRS